jgi:hypothetical protein
VRAVPAYDAVMRPWAWVLLILAMLISASTIAAIAQLVAR